MIQYRAYNGPVGTSSDWTESDNGDVLPAWHPKYHPVRSIEYRHTLPSFFFGGDPTGFEEPVDPTDLPFHVIAPPVLLPLVLLSEVHTYLNDADFVEPPTDDPAQWPPSFHIIKDRPPVIDISYVWPSAFQHLNPIDFIDPVELQPETVDGLPFRDHDYRYLLPSLFTNLEPTGFVEPIATSETNAWLQPTEIAIYPVEYRHLLPTWFFQGEPVEFANADLYLGDEITHTVISTGPSFTFTVIPTSLVLTSYR